MSVDQSDEVERQRSNSITSNDSKSSSLGGDRDELLERAAAFGQQLLAQVGEEKAKNALLMERIHDLETQMASRTPRQHIYEPIEESDDVSQSPTELRKRQQLLRKQLLDLEVTRNALEDDLEAKNSEIDTLKKELSNALKQTKYLKNELDEVQVEFRSNVESLRDENVKLSKKLVESKKETERLNEQIGVLSVPLNSSGPKWRAAAADASAELASTKAGTQRLREELKEVKETHTTEIHSLKEQMRRLEAERDEALELARDARVRFDRAEKDCENLRAELANRSHDESEARPKATESMSLLHELLADAQRKTSESRGGGGADSDSNVQAVRGTEHVPDALREHFFLTTSASKVDLASSLPSEAEAIFGIDDTLLFYAALNQNIAFHRWFQWVRETICCLLNVTEVPSLHSVNPDGLDLQTEKGWASAWMQERQEEAAARAAKEAARSMLSAGSSTSPSRSTSMDVASSPPSTSSSARYARSSSQRAKSVARISVESDGESPRRELFSNNELKEEEEVAPTLQKSTSWWSKFRGN